MKYLIKLFFALTIITTSACFAFESLEKPPAAPSRKCEIRTSSWCIMEGINVIQRELADDSINARIWILSDYFMPESKLVILEPNGCKTGLSDDVELIDVSNNYIWRNATWNRIIFKLKSSDDCDLTLLIPPKTDNPMQWQYNEGLISIVPCSNNFCDDVSLYRFSPLIESRLAKKSPE